MMERVEIKKIGINGEGIGYIDKKICFIENALPGKLLMLKSLRKIENS